jgi:glucose-1-phosphate thymidylyltransferase
MRAPAAGALLSPAQEAAAARGAKAMMPVGRPFLDYVLGSLAEAGMGRVVLVVGAADDEILRRYTREVVPRRLELSFAEQREPLGTADALLRAEPFVGAASFLLVNGDNLYPVAALAELARLGRPGLIGYERRALVREGNFDAERIGRFALIRTAADGTLAAIVEKPDAATLRELGPNARVSMNS